MSYFPNKIYKDQARLCLQTLSLINDDSFALKGGTALNFFYHSLPRLSVDIDLTYVPITPRKEALSNISTSLKRLSGFLQGRMPGCRIDTFWQGNHFNKVLLRLNNLTVKVEVSELRGTILPVEERELAVVAQKEFEMTFKTNTVSLHEIYGGKICAALDRQHPRDLFDIKTMLNEEGFTERTRQAFVVYLVCHNRPIHELLDPNYKDIDRIFHEHFRGMTKEIITLEELESVRTELFSRVQFDLTDEEREFILSVQENRPKWGLLPFPDLNRLPGIRWKLANLAKMDDKKKTTQTRLLMKILER